MSKRNLSNASTKLKRQKAADDPSPWQEFLAQFTRAIDTSDMQAASARVAAERVARPDDTTELLVEHLIRSKCLKTGSVGAVTSGAALIPGVGTVASLTLGVAADIGATFTLQADLVLEIAAAHGHTLTDDEKRTVVLLITGMSGGANKALATAGEQVTRIVAERYAQKWLAHALPVAGIVASAATNVLTTYLVGKRADAYFRLSPEAIGDWAEIWRAITGVDEREVGTWFAEQAATSWHLLHGHATWASAELARAGTTVTQAAASAGTTVTQAAASTGATTMRKAGDLAATISAGAASTAGVVADAATSTRHTVSDAALATGRAVQNGVRDAAHRAGTLFKRGADDTPLPDDPGGRQDQRGTNDAPLSDDPSGPGDDQGGTA